MLYAKDAEPRAIYRATRSDSSAAGVVVYYTLVSARVARALVKRYEAKGAAIRTDEMLELKAARDSLAGQAVLFVRHMRGRDRVTGKRWEMDSYRALPLDFKLRALKRPPSTRKAASP